MVEKNFAVHSMLENFFKVYTFRLPFFKLSDLPNCPVKYLDNCKIECTDFIVVPSPAFVACISLCESGNVRMYITAHETDTTKRLLEVGIVPMAWG